MQEPIFRPYQFNKPEKAQLDHDGHLVLPGLLTDPACARLIASLDHVRTLPPTNDPTKKLQPPHYAAEYDPYLASLIAHPQMLDLARRVLGAEIRFDHCVALTRQSADPGQRWHTHNYAEDQLELGFLRIFFYVNGFGVDDGGLRVVPGSHLYREGALYNISDEELQAGWLRDKHHPLTGAPLDIQSLEAPPGTVILMWTHALHSVSARREESETRWTVVYAYRNPGAPSRARWITQEFEHHPPAGAEGLLSLF